jgi:uncharacterized repeat protein (TIGR03803 family)
MQIFNKRRFRIILASGCLACWATTVALAQPIIATQPANEFLSPGAGAAFSVTATGMAPLTYEWLFDGTAIAGATNRGLNLGSPQPAQWGYYSVIVSNMSGSVTSQVAELKVFGSALHRMNGIQAESAGAVLLSFAGETVPSFALYYDMYPLEISSNLFDWAPLTTVQRTNEALDTLSYLDTNAVQDSQRFYRTPTSQLLTPDLQPTGPYPVGTFSMALTNTNRGNARFMVTFWYPAVVQTVVLPTKYVEPIIALSGDNFYDLSGSGGGNFDAEVAAFYSHSISNAPVATNLPARPIVLYDPGDNGHRRENTDKAEELASWGYVVVGLDTSDTYVSVFPDGTVVYGQLNANGSGAALIQDEDVSIEARLKDMQFVLDTLEIMNSDDPRLAGRLDLNRIGAFGWSAGGATAAQLCLRDPRCKAGAGLDGLYFETNLVTQPLSVPWLFFDEDDLIPDPALDLPYVRPDDRPQVYNSLVTNAYWVKLVSTVHGDFSDPGLIDDPASLVVYWGTPLSNQYLTGGRVSEVVRAYLLSFFNKFLEGEDDHLLDGPAPAYPEVLKFLSTSSSSAPSEYPSAPLVQDLNGDFYGTTAYGGANDNGTVFVATANGALTTLVSFNGTNGSHPVAPIVQGSDGNFYGTTEYGGTNANLGTVFQLTPGGTLTMLTCFNGANGSYPAAALVQGSNGNFYGTTTAGGTFNYGTVFQVTPAGVLTTLATFNEANGNDSEAPLTQASNGLFYGTTVGQGANTYGTVFSMTPLGALTTVASFDGGDGEAPTAGVVQGTNGDFYGTAPYGGNLNLNGGNGLGTVFKMTPTGAITTLVSFNGANGSFAATGLIQGGDGNLYGTTSGGGASGGGTVFEITPAGVLTTLVEFNGANGYNPAAGLLLGNDNNFYGTTEFGGAGGLGTMFQMTPAGTLTTLASFGVQTNAP